MIQKKDVFQIGHFYKTHGISGELAFSYTTDVFNRTDFPYLLIEMDGILVPFFVQSCRIRSGSSALIRLEGIDNELKARMLAGKDVLYPAIWQEDNEPEPDDWAALIGFHVTDEACGPLGEVIAVDDATINVLLVVSYGRKEVLIPLAGDFITGIDADKHELWVLLPQDLLDLQV